ncbi:hypothetical protein PybrP1_006871 [[Pythium] brassicae (nom. inval.)]|nr:hypothetical protein PybrP1_006871 [[Pythium] brassicae (nom. inval.)]
MLADDAADAAAPLLYESLGGARSPPAGAARGGLRFGLSARQWSRADGGGDAAPPERQSSYTDLHALGVRAAHRNELGTINGVYVPCLLNIIGVILFLRLGWGVGQAGVLGMLLIFCVAEAQAVLTVLSASTIASNGAMRGGGSYFLISRSLGPEFGGAIGVQFYFLYAVGVAMYLVGFAEEAQQTWFPDPEIGKKPTVVAIATLALAMILGIAVVGANAFARVNKYLFVLQFACVAVGALFIYTGSPHPLKSGGWFTGMSAQTFADNLREQFTSEQNVCGDNVVCTVAGVYGKSLPVGTLAAVGTSWVIYLVLIFTFAAAYTGETLRSNFSFFQEASKYPFVVITGVLVSCFSSGLGSLFGASRILQAIARDNLFPGLSILARGTDVGDEPRNAVLFTAVLAQVFICFGDLDVIAPICTSFFCLAYAAVNMTCFLLQVTGVPNFRPTFRYHSWHLSLLGTALNLGVMIYLNATYAAVSLVVLSCMFFYLYMTVAPVNWGDISQAIMYHQVRKFLLRLDARKAHSKYWRPSLLLLTDEIECAEVRLCDSLKKGGLYVIGSVVTADFGLESNARCSEKHNAWLEHIFDTKLKAIPQVVVVSHVRDGYRMLMQTSGLGGMQINTVVALPDVNPLRQSTSGIGVSSAADYVSLIADGIALKKNVVVLRHADRLDARLLRKHGARKSCAPADKLIQIDDQRGTETIDVWITGGEEEASTALMLQLAYVLFSNKEWKRRTKLRLIKVCTTTDPAVTQRERLRLVHAAEKLRVLDHVSEMLVVCCNSSSILADTLSPHSLAASATTDDFFSTTKGVVELNQTLQRHTTRTAQLLLALPDPRPYLLAAADSVGVVDADVATATQSQVFVSKLALLTANLPSTLLVFNDDDSQMVSTSI